MSTFNELCLEIEDLKKKIEEEPRKRLKRRLMIEDNIKQLEDDKKRAGLRGEPASVQKFNTQIKKLEHELAGGIAWNYENDLKVLKHKLLDMVVNHYNDGHDIEDIFQIEDVSQNIRDGLLNKSNFGKTTGFLFVDEIDNDNDYNWRYYDPINDIEFKSKTLDDLEYQIKSCNEVFLIFDDNIANKSQNKDLQFYQIKIDKCIEDLNKYASYQVFSKFKLLSDKFSKDKIKRLYDYTLENIKYSNNFIEILLVNCDKFSQDEIDGIYCGLIDNGIKKLENPNINQNEIYDVFDYLSSYSSKFSSKQLHRLCDIVIGEICGFNKKFISILKDNGDEFDNVYKKIIDQRINALKDINSHSESSKYLIKDLRYLNDKFNKTQLNKLTKIIVSNSNICNFADDFRYILKTNGGENSKIYEKIIDSRIKDLINSDSEFPCIFKDLKVFAYKFNKTQINTFIDIVRDGKYSSCCDENISHIISANENNLNGNYHNLIIEMKINEKLNELNNIVFGYRDARLILECLEIYADSFNEAQLTRLCNIAITNNQVYDCDFCKDSLMSILSDNKDKIDKKLYDETILKNNLIRGGR